jgi:aryl-alcohol dehydrogenase-like predicted oxidoreductase
MRAVDDSLRRLQTDYIDLYQTHWPHYDTPQEETLRALDDLVKAGKVRYIGCSNEPAWRLMKALAYQTSHNLNRFISSQPPYSLVRRASFEREHEAVCLDQGVGVIPYSPLQGGFLTGKYRRDSTPDSVRAEGLKKYFTERNYSPDRPAGRARPGPQRQRRADGPGLDAAAPGHHRAHHRRQQRRAAE